MHKVLSVIAVSMVSSDNILCRHKHKDKYQSFCRKGIYISLTISMTATLLEEISIAKLKSLVITLFLFVHIHSSISHVEKIHAQLYMYILQHKIRLPRESNHK